ncbi:MAG: hypothetical protein ACUVQ4_08695 [bacterium]
MGVNNIKEKNGKNKPEKIAEKLQKEISREFYFSSETIIYEMPP